jgi:predicted DNA-binding transcriptional regulator AlpA
MADLAAALRALADRVDALAPADLVGELERIRFTIWQGTTTGPTPPPAPGPSRALAIEEVVERTGMSKQWLYRQARQGALPFARRLGRRLVFDEAGLRRWLDRRRPG